MADEQCARCEELQSQLDDLFSEDGCPRCGQGVSSVCLGCLLRAEQERSEAQRQALAEISVICKQRGDPADAANESRRLALAALEQTK